jgi:hypothetical protein
MSIPIKSLRSDIRRRKVVDGERVRHPEIQPVVDVVAI